MEMSVFQEFMNRIRGDSFNPQPPGEVRFWIWLSLAVSFGNARLDARGVSLRLNGPRLAAAG